MLWVLPVVWAAMFVFLLVPTPRSPPISGAESLPPTPAAQPAVVAPVAASLPAAPVVEPAPAVPVIAPPAPVAAPKAAAKAEPGRSSPEVKAPKPVEAAPVAPTVAPPEPAAVEVPRVSRAQVVVEEVDSFTVRCGDKSAEGTVSARIANFPAGTCAVRASVGGKTVAGSVQVTGPREVRCRVDGEALRCS